jgi:hypothetical protein
VTGATLGTHLALQLAGAKDAATKLKLLLLCRSHLLLGTFSAGTGGQQRSRFLVPAVLRQRLDALFGSGGDDDHLSDGSGGAKSSSRNRDNELLNAAHARNARLVLYQIYLLAFPRSPLLLRAVCGDLQDDNSNDPLIVAAAASALARLPADPLLRFFARPKEDDPHGDDGGGGVASASSYETKQADEAVERLLGHEDPAVAACCVAGLARAALRAWGLVHIGGGRLKQEHAIGSRGFESLEEAQRFADTVSECVSA